MGNTYNQPPETPFCDLQGPGHHGLAMVQLYLMPATFLCVLIFGLPLNLLSLWVFCHRMKRWTRSTVLIFNLALADASWLLALPFIIFFHLDRLDWTLGPDLCKALRLLYHNYFYLSICFVCAVSLDRYLAIVHPLRSMALLGARRQTCALCVATWLITLVLSAPVAHMTLVQTCPGANRSVCTLTGESLPYSLFSSIAGFLLPLACICCCCALSVRELRRLPRRLMQPPQQQQPQAQAPPPHQLPHRPLPPPPHHRRWRRLVRALSAALALFALFYLPYHLSRNAAIAVRATHPRSPASWRTADLLFAVAMCVCSLNACVNPLFSCFVGRQFRRECRDALRAALWRPRCPRGGGGGGEAPKGAAVTSRGHPGLTAVAPL
ncbi:P2Y purinoceptor 1 [Merluccius polli]|uniref:P2Y purinoceptor 1 n=1 Tax=Merluccius polli TaxID=89951 RepID=A0AA47ML51_MERPO|nr:P2Y purinoceptor 1 [Merluccius polli]